MAGTNGGNPKNKAKVVGWIYVFTNEAFKGMLKIGFTTLDPKERALKIFQAAGVPYKFEVAYCAETVSPAEKEEEIHKRLSKYRVYDGTRATEFFKIDLKTAISIIEEIIPPALGVVFQRPKKSTQDRSHGLPPENSLVELNGGSEAGEPSTFNYFEEDDEVVFNSSGNQRPFSIRKMMFIEEYLRDENAPAAALRAGCHPYMVYHAAKRMLDRPDVQQAIKIRKAELSDKLKLDTQKILNEYSKLAFFNIRDLYDANGNLRNIKDLPADLTAAIQSVDVEMRFRGRGEDREEYALLKVRGPSKKEALDSLSRIKNLFKEDNKIDVQVSIKEFLEALPEEMRESIKAALAAKMGIGVAGAEATM